MRTKARILHYARMEKPARNTLNLSGYIRNLQRKQSVVYTAPGS